MDSATASQRKLASGDEQDLFHLDPTDLLLDLACQGTDPALPPVMAPAASTKWKSLAQVAVASVASSHPLLLRLYEAEAVDHSEEADQDHCLHRPNPQNHPREKLLPTGGPESQEPNLLHPYDLDLASLPKDQQDRLPSGLEMPPTLMTSMPRKNEWALAPSSLLLLPHPSLQQVLLEAAHQDLDPVQARPTEGMDLPSVLQLDQVKEPKHGDPLDRPLLDLEALHLRLAHHRKLLAQRLLLPKLKGGS